MLMSENFYSSLRPARVPLSLATLALIVGLIATVYYGVIGGALHDSANYFCVAMCVLAVAAAHWVMPRNFAVGFLVSTLLWLTNWRVAAMMNIWPVMIVSAVIAVIYVAMFLDCLQNNWNQAAPGERLSGLEWQMTVVRIYFGFDMVGHFTEKLFAGSASFHHMSTVFGGFGIATPGPFVIMGGLCELAIAIGIGIGLLSRLAALGATLYFAIANHYGAHFDNGFTWANGPDGGWEYPMLMAIFYLSFALSGAGRFSLDGWLLARGFVPRRLLVLFASQRVRDKAIVPAASA
ncbi:DoxX family protein [Paraburkholderia sp. J94]|uniref:DoxX family protein n=1 Tax=Paraburkholderia sp. J94 TaxID=2805441 RepID=UPI002AB2F5A5|nr:DoxX family protein [Paraburkholderia sp. J94]